MGPKASVPGREFRDTRALGPSCAPPAERLFSRRSRRARARRCRGAGRVLGSVAGQPAASVHSMPAASLLLFWVLAAQEPAPDALTRVRALLEQGALDRALLVLEAALRPHPQDAALQRMLAQTLERTVDGGGSWLALSDARDAWDRALALVPDELETQRGAIAVRLRLGEYGPALELAERALGAAWLTDG